MTQPRSGDNGQHPLFVAAILEATDALGLDDGSFRGGDEAEALISGYEPGEGLAAREGWLARFADAVRRYWA